MLTVLVQTPDMDQLRQLLPDLPAVASTAAERPGCSIVVIDETGRPVPLAELERG